jgi:hypothetical protein
MRKFLAGNSNCAVALAVVLLAAFFIAERRPFRCIRIACFGRPCGAYQAGLWFQ